jgi:NAD(P)H-dependent FMN reductase
LTRDLHHPWHTAHAPHLRLEALFDCKNGIDWVIGSGELHQKVVTITAAVGHPERGARGLRALRGTLRAIDAKIVWDEPIVLGSETAEQIRELQETLVAMNGSGVVTLCG